MENQQVFILTNHQKNTWKNHNRMSPQACLDSYYRNHKWIATTIYIPIFIETLFTYANMKFPKYPLTDK